jgi:ElaB/YqjD/DUF883 family membrane-anchored ribosome-binding protein
MTSSARLQEEANVARAGLSSALDDLRQNVTTTAITNGAMTFAKDGSTAVARAAVDRATANPLATMVIGAGLLMLMIGDKKVSSAVSGLVDQGKSAAKSAADGISSTAGNAADRVKEMTAARSDQMAESRQQASDLLDEGQRQTQDLLSKGQEQGQQVLQQAHQFIEQNRGKFEQFAQEQPIVVAALGVAIGAAIGASLPISEVEREYLSDPTRRAARKVGVVAQKAADAATDKLAGQDLPNKVGTVVEAISSTVTQNLQRR